MFLGLEMLDTLNMYFVAPCLISQAVCVTSMYYASRSLEAPLWLARQMYIVGVFSVMATLILAYKMLASNMEVDESRKVLMNIQKQLDVDRSGTRSQKES